MKRPEHIVIGMLAGLAVVLAVLLGTSFLATPEAQATGPAAQRFNSDYQIIGVKVSEKKGLLYVVNVAQKRLLAYSVDNAGNRVLIAGAVNLEQAFAAR
jgi:6-phosphogluconolactonase (cycloisomerase 2 family)